VRGPDGGVPARDSLAFDPQESPLSSESHHCVSRDPKLSSFAMMSGRW
jgi:hypothetical protein